MSHSKPPGRNGLALQFSPDLQQMSHVFSSLIVIFCAWLDPHCAFGDTKEVRRTKLNLIRNLLDTDGYFLRSPLFSSLWFRYFSALPFWSSFLAPFPLPTIEPLCPWVLLFLLLYPFPWPELCFPAENFHIGSEPGSDIISCFPDPQNPFSSLIYYFLNLISTKVCWAKGSLFPFYRKKHWDSDLKGRLEVS